MAMKMTLSGQMRMEQQMKLAPRMIQAMEVLQLPLMALQERIETELNNNPVLEVDEPQVGSALGSAQTTEPPAEDDEKELVVDDQRREEDFQRLENLGEDFEDYLNKSAPILPISTGGDPDKKMEALLNTADNGKSLNDWLKEQWRLVEAEPNVKTAGETIIDFLDEKGYLTVRLEQLLNPKQPFSLEDLRKALELVQKLDPPGIGARDLRECLLIQLRQQTDDVDFEIQLVEHYWQELLENRLPQIAKKMNVPLERLSQAIERLSKLDTSPGLSFGRQDNPPIVADLVVEPNEEGGFTVRLVDGFVPTLKINTMYKRMAKDPNADENTRQFLKKNIRSAQWFMQAIEQRKQTLLKVAQAIVRHQEDFFRHGKLHLKPLPMSLIAQEVGVHVATVSRAVAGKYVDCPQGILPLRSFFSGGLEDEQGQAHSYDAVKAKLKEIVDNEDKTNPLSDDEIREKLAQAGFGQIARRTVAKYRQMLNIPPARHRRRYSPHG